MSCLPTMRGIMKTKIISICGWILLLTLSGLSQYKSIPQMSGIGMPYFEAKIFTGIDSAQTYIDVLVQILNDDLTFTKKDSQFVADTELALNIIKDNRIVYNKIINNHYREEEFTKTNDRRKKNIISQRVKLAPGKYLVDLSLKDVFTARKLKRSFNVIIPDLQNEELFVGDLIFYSGGKKEEAQKSLSVTPNIEQNFNSDDPYIFIYFKTFVKKPGDSLEVYYVIEEENGYTAEKGKYILTVKDCETIHRIKIKKKKIQSGKCLLKLKLKYHNAERQKSALITFFWNEAPENIKDLDSAVEQLKYIVPYDSLRKIKKLPFEEKKKQFIKLWEIMDPDPSTAVNELMDEYYKRVNYANAKFSNSSYDGWNTDRGRIYIKFGPPDEIQYEKMPMGTMPYEIWTYYELNKQFLFISNGFGGYELHPDYIQQEYD